MAEIPVYGTLVNNTTSGVLARAAQITVDGIEQGDTVQEVLENISQTVTERYDTELSITSKNAVQNKVITTELNKKAVSADLQITQGSDNAIIKLKQGVQVQVLTRHQDLAPYVLTTQLSDVAFSGNYQDLVGVPELPDSIEIVSEIIEGDTKAVAGGAIYDALQQIYESIDAIEDELHPVTIILQSSASPLEYDGTNKQITFNINLSKGGSVVTPTTSRIVCDGSESQSGQLVISRSSRNSYTASATATVNGKNYGPKTATVKIMHAMRIGFAGSTVNPTDLVKQSLKNSVAVSNYTVNNQITGNYLWICVDDSLTVSKVTSDGGFEVILAETVERIQGYKCYRSYNPINVGPMIITVS